MSDIKKSHRGLLHKLMGFATGKKIPAEALAKEKSKAKKTGNKAEVKRVVYAQNMRKSKSKSKK